MAITALVIGVVERPPDFIKCRGSSIFSTGGECICLTRAHARLHRRVSAPPSAQAAGSANWPT